jgi:hypothetical protein
MRPLSFLLAALAGCTAASAVFAQGAYLPEPGRVDAASFYSFQRTRDFYALGDTRFTLGDPLEQQTVRLDLDYGLAPGWAADLSVGWSTVSYDETQPPFLGVSLLRDGRTRQSGLIDTRLGLRRTVLDEFASINEWTPTVAVRAGAIIEGDYDTGYITAPGDGSSGVELSLLAAKSLPATSTTLFGDLIWRGYGGAAPDAIEASFGVSQRVRAVVLTGGVRHLHALDGGDILGPGFIRPDGSYAFPSVREINTSLEAGLAVPLGPVTVALGFARTVKGENTPKKTVWCLGVSGGF